MPALHRRQSRARWGIIADDLTGATDVAAAFAARGVAALAVLSLRARLPSRAELLVLTTNSRHDPPDSARRKVQRACRWLRERRVPVLYKKIDSTVKGNIVAEVEAIRAAGRFVCALVCPANPEQGRVVRRGVLRLLDEVERFLPAGLLRVRDEVLGLLPEIFAAQGMDRSTVVHRPVSAKKVMAAIRTGARFVIADAANQRDLATLARAGLDLPARGLLVGSAGLAAAVAEALVAREPRRSAAEAQITEKWKRSVQSASLPRKPGLVVVFVGSHNPVTLRQLDALVQHAHPKILSLDALARVSIARDFLGSARCLVVRVPVHQRSDAAIVRNLRRLLPLFQSGRVAAMVLTGGDTALLMCRWLRVTGILIQGEIVPGLAWGGLVGGAADGLPVCTKPGGFGDEWSLVAAVNFLSSSRFLTFSSTVPNRAGIFHFREV